VGVTGWMEMVTVGAKWVVSTGVRACDVVKLRVSHWQWVCRGLLVGCQEATGVRSVCLGGNEEGWDWCWARSAVFG
jgi:hypothetical protein